jgi:drug/metabolite transporter (DMT)-like permease
MADDPMLTVLLALIASVLFALGNVLQQRIAMGYSDGEADSPWFLLKLVRSPVWLAGMAIILVGFCFHAGALSGGEIVVVQPILSLVLVLSLPLGVWLSNQHIGRREVVLSAVVTIALAAFLVLSNPAAGVEHPTGSSWLVAAAAVVVPVAALVAAGIGRSLAAKAALVGTAAGILFGLHGALVKGAVEQFDSGILGPLESWEAYAVVVGAIVGLSLAQISLQPGVLPPAMATQSIATPVVGVALGVTLFEETIHDSTLGLVASLAALAVMMAGIAGLSMRPRSVPDQLADADLGHER